MVFNRRLRVGAVRGGGTVGTLASRVNGVGLSGIGNLAFWGKGVVLRRALLVKVQAGVFFFFG